MVVTVPLDQDVIFGSSSKHKIMRYQITIAIETSKALQKLGVFRVL